MFEEGKDALRSEPAKGVPQSEYNDWELEAKVSIEKTEWSIKGSTLAQETRTMTHPDPLYVFFRVE